MEVLQASVAVVASMVVVLTGIVVYLYWQQARLFQNMNSIAMVLGDLSMMAVRSAEQPPPVEVAPPPVEPPVEEEEEEDDRVSVEKTETIDGPPPALDLDSLPEKSKKELQDILTKRGIPYSKSDAKSALISLLKATA